MQSIVSTYHGKALVFENVVFTGQKKTMLVALPKRRGIQIPQPAWMPSATTGLLLSNVKAEWLRHNHKKMLVADRLSPSTQTHTHVGMNTTILFYSYTNPLQRQSTKVTICSIETFNSPFSTNKPTISINTVLIPHCVNLPTLKYPNVPPHIGRKLQESSQLLPGSGWWMCQVWSVQQWE